MILKRLFFSFLPHRNDLMHWLVSQWALQRTPKVLSAVWNLIPIGPYLGISSQNKTRNFANF